MYVCMLLTEPVFQDSGGLVDSIGDVTSVIAVRSVIDASIGFSFK